MKRGIVNFVGRSMPVEISVDAAGAIAINEDGQDVDFRVESDARTHAIFMEASTGSTGFYDQSTPAYPVDVLCNRASEYAAKFTNDGDNANRYGIIIQGGADNASGTTTYIQALDGGGGEIGKIQNINDTFTFVDGSDERLKEDIVDTKVKGLETINTLKVRDFKWKKSGITCQAGFIAQEMLGVFDPAVSGRPDEKETHQAKRAVGDIVDKEGDVVEASVDIRDYRRNKKDLGEFVQTEEPVMGERDKMMGVSRERLVPVLVKAVQELSAKVAALENRGG